MMSPTKKLKPKTFKFSKTPN